MNIIEQALALREGGQTQRCHTMQYMGPYNVAIHSYNALSLLLLLYPKHPSLNLIKAVLWHDVPERWTGDVPTPAKLANPFLKEILGTLEQRIFNDIGIGGLFKCLKGEEKRWLDAVDLLELFMWVQEQMKMGNSIVDSVLAQILKIVENNRSSIPKEVLSFFREFKWSRTPEIKREQ